MFLIKFTEFNFTQTSKIKIIAVEKRRRETKIGIDSSAVTQLQLHDDRHPHRDPSRSLAT